jgi:isoleucyl-tRNA synthetase
MGKNIFPETPTAPQFARLEEEVLRFWQEKQIFAQTAAARHDAPPFVFYEGPPTANGKPGIHHVITRAIKDIVCRYKTMQGFRVDRKAGWDTHGLPVEIEVEKQLGFSGKAQIEAYGIEKFNKKCRASVFKYKEEWDKFTTRIAFWLDLEHPYITCTNEYIESLWWSLKVLWDKGLIYQGHKILPYCPRCGTPLSSHEVSQGYKDVEDPSVFLKVKARGADNQFFLVWTTTPWTLISNVALAVHPAAAYVRVAYRGQELILAKERLADTLEGDAHILEEFPGAALAGREYERLYDFAPVDKPAFRVVTADFVTMTDGTGMVHMAPAFGEDDYRVGQAQGLPVLQLVDPDGKFPDAVTPWAGRPVKQADPDIIADLEQRGLLHRSGKFLHSYPFCWRCDSPLIYYARKSWYIKTTALNTQMLAHNRGIHWHPREIGEGRFGNWLENNIDWACSRDRYWGTPLNIWICETCRHMDAIGSIAELRARGADVPADIELHRPYVDRVRLTCPQCGGAMQRTPEVLDCWYDSGSMPFAQWHYPFENKEEFEKHFPADFISEAIDQTRGWFYTLLACSTLLFDKPSYRHVIVCDLILDKLGKKMSKSKGNVVDPWDVINRFGADALRWYLVTANPPWISTRFDPNGVQEVHRKFLSTFINTLAFFTLYANIDGYQPATDNAVPLAARPDIDRWVLSRLNTTLTEVHELMERYDLTKAGRRIQQFLVDEVSNWYVRRSRRKFWKAEMGLEKKSAYQTLYEVLTSTALMAAPFAPFLAEYVYRTLTTDAPGRPVSVHMDRFPQGDPRAVDAKLEHSMDLVLKTVAVGRSLRSASGLKVRQPLARIVLENIPPADQGSILAARDLIIDEINVKAIEFTARLDRNAPGLVFGAEGDFAAALDTTLTTDLIDEGFAREFINKLQNLRKDAGFAVTDRIRVLYQASPRLAQALTRHAAHIAAEVLADEFTAVADPGAAAQPLKINDEPASIAIAKKES